MTDLFEHDRCKTQAAMDLIQSDIAAGTISKKRLYSHMELSHGSGSASGAWTQRDAFEHLEAGLIAHLTDVGQNRSVEQLAALTDSLPTQTVRSEEQIEYQQFTTPAELSKLMVELAQPKSSDVVLEPSAGHGMLAAMLPKTKELYLNELDQRRAGRLQALFPNIEISSFDAALLGSCLPPSVAPTLTMMNPPFSRSAGRGVDRYAALRHLRAAIRKAAPAGRIVAIMPEWFTTSAKEMTNYRETFEGCTVQSSALLRSCYRKHGTSIAVRLYVIDKVPGEISPAIIARDTVIELARDIDVKPRAIAARKPAAIKASTGTGLFKASKTPVRARIPTRPKVSAPSLEDLRYRALETPRPLGEAQGVYLAYRPSRVDIMKAGEHPTALVESVAMGSIPSPIPDYKPKTTPAVLRKALLSEAQLETVIYAGTAWSQYLPGRYDAGEGVEIVPNPEGRKYRKGYFLGDGTGAGKGRQIAGVILDNWLQGRRRAIWISKNETLLEDARRDWTALGGLSADIQPLSNWKIDQPVPFHDGILFVTYPTLRSQRDDATRLNQVIEWADDDFEGVIAFDESHEMGGVAGGEGARGAKAGSLQGIAGVLLQNRLPDARVLYASATGASDVNNLAYAVRLGLWGAETAFSSREDFIAQIRAGGIAAMELVSRDLKALGLYQARALSFAGVEYEILKHELTQAQIADYDAYAAAWAIIHRNMEQALKDTGIVDDMGGETLNSGAKAAARSRFESCKQRFFNQVLLSMKLPSVIASIDEHLDEQFSVVVQLVSTAEAILDRRLGQLSAEERAELDIDLSPREAVIDYLERAFPTQQMRIFTDDTGAERSEPMFDDEGRPVHNQYALEAKQSLLEDICAMPPIKPALDALIEHYGTEKVAEVTGRTKRLINASDGTQKLESRTARTNQSETEQFMDGRKRILVFSDAGGTGRSYHASLECENQERRVHFLLEPGWRADRAIQGLGRTHRTHQAASPLFKPVTTNCKGELRFTSTIARRLDSLGALTRGQRQTGGQNLFDPADNLESSYAKAALNEWFHLLSDGKLKSTTMQEFVEMSGLRLQDQDGVLVEELPPIQRWLNRILAMPIGIQNAIFEEFLGLVEANVEAARKAGTLDLGVETIPASKARIVNDHLLRKDDRTGATSHLLEIEIDAKVVPLRFEQIEERSQWVEEPRLLFDAKSGKVAFAETTRSMMRKDGTLLKRLRLTRPTHNQYVLADEIEEGAWEECSPDKFKDVWESESQAAAANTRKDRLFIATGLLLPIWSSLPRDYIAVRRIVDDEGNSWLGRLVDDEDVPKVLNAFGLEGECKVDAAMVIKALEARKPIQIQQPYPMTFKRSLVAGEWRYEIADVDRAQLTWLKSIGCFTEIQQYRTRIYIPSGKAEAIIKAILKA